jgi:hypothetical protein
MIFMIKRGSTFPKSVAIEPWAVGIELAVGDVLKLDIYGISNESEVSLEDVGDGELCIYAPKIVRVDVSINGVDVSKQYCMQ